MKRTMDTNSDEVPTDYPFDGGALRRTSWFSGANDWDDPRITGVTAAFRMGQWADEKDLPPADRTRLRQAAEGVHRALPNNDWLPIIDAATGLLVESNLIGVLHNDDHLAQETRQELRQLEAKSPGGTGRVGRRLLESIETTAAGRRDAHQFHHLVANFLTYLFAPQLRDPRIEAPLNGGRKRVDLVYTNEATTGFFHWVRQFTHAPFVYVEVKNYTGDPGNPELDQLSGRLNPARGLLGILACPTVADPARMLERLKDIQRKGEYCIVLTIDDMRTLAQQAGTGPDSHRFPLLIEKFRDLV
jgi:hypothetical protein